MTMYEVIKDLEQNNPMMKNHLPSRHGVWQLRPGGTTVHLSMHGTGQFSLSWFDMPEWAPPEDEKEFEIDQAELLRCAVTSSAWYMDEFVE